ncbi:MAG TPA: hypothetical protein DCO67_06445 [Staphylococcus sp.]|nr:hypothetical protein [Staphylococcus sp.]
MQKILYNVQKERLNWAFDAKDDFMNQFSTFKNENVKNKKIVISVYGSTQAGKTTLILSLLGIQNKYFNEINTVLRGGRSIGNSATVTATKFKSVNGSKYILKHPKKAEIVLSSLKDLELKLQNIREEVESFQYMEVEPILIGIPKEKFKKEFLNGFDKLEIIDLPGIESAEKKEIDHVNRCINYWIPNSHKTIIVGRSTDLTFYRDVSNGFLKEWYIEKEKNIIVLTRSFSPESIKSRQWENPSEIIDHYKIGLEKLLNSEQGNIKIPNNIFPVEIGDSYNLLPEDFQKIAQKLFEDLRNNILNTNFHKVSFNHLKEFYRQIVKRESEEIKKIESEKQSMEVIYKSKYTNYKNVLNKLEIKKDMYKDKYADLSYILEELKLIKAKYKSIDLYIVFINKVINSSDKMHTKSILDEEFSKSIIKINNKLQSYIDELNSLIKEFDNDFIINKDIAISFNSKDSFLNIFLTKKSFKKHMNQLKNRLEEDVSDELSDINQLVEKLEKSINKQLSYEKYNEIKIQDIIHEKNNEFEKIKVEYEDWKSECMNLLVKTKKQFSKDVEQARNYKSYFIKHFKLKQNRLLEMFDSKNIDEVQYAQIALIFLEEDAEIIIRAMEVG